MRALELAQWMVWRTSSTWPLEWNAEQLFLPAENYRQALEILKGKSSLKLSPVLPETNLPQPDRLLREYLARIGVPPPPDAPFLATPQSLLSR